MIIEYKYTDIIFEIAVFLYFAYYAHNVHFEPISRFIVFIFTIIFSMLHLPFLLM